MDCVSLSKIGFIYSLISRQLYNPCGSEIAKTKSPTAIATGK